MRPWFSFSMLERLLTFVSILMLSVVNVCHHSLFFSFGPYLKKYAPETKLQFEKKNQALMWAIFFNLECYGALIPPDTLIFYINVVTRFLT